jgi:FAD/FMN-containing dehydrogenase
MGDMTERVMTAALGEATLAEFGASLHGELILPGDERYDAARAVWNGMIDRRPALIVRCQGVSDVIAATQFARGHNLPVAVRGGSHNVAGNATCDGGVVIDLSLMRSIRVDPRTRTARVEAGALWRDFDHEAQAFGLATTGGLISTTGIAGFTLGGGIGWLMRKYGLACDNLLSADVVTADGQFLTASASEHQDLLWGLRGGGGNFGVVTSFEFQLHLVPTVLGGPLFYAGEQTRAALRFYRAFCASAPDELTTMAELFTAPAEEYIPEHLHGTRMLAIGVCYCGAIEAGEEAIRPLRTFGPPVVDLVGPMSYTGLQTMFDAEYPAGMRHYWKSDYLGDLSDAAIDAILACDARVTSPYAQIHIHHMGGAVKRVGGVATAFGHRDAPYLVNELGTWTEEDDQDASAHIAWVRGLSAALRPFSTGAYVNFLAGEGEVGVRAAYDPATYARLVDVKRRYDPTNLFHLNQNIPPEG